MKFKLSRKRKKKYKKDVNFSSKTNFKFWMEKENWEWFYFKKRIYVRCLEVILTYPEYNVTTGKYSFNPKLHIKATNEQLLSWYQLYYPNDFLSHHFCKQNRHKWDKFNSTI